MSYTVTELRILREEFMRGLNHITIDRTKLNKEPPKLHISVDPASGKYESVTIIGDVIFNDDNAERFKLIDKHEGTFEYIGEAGEWEPIKPKLCDLSLDELRKLKHEVCNVITILEENKKFAD